MLKRTPQPEPLGERIERIRAEAEAFIESKIREMKTDCPGVPEQVLRNLVENRAKGCPCQQALELERS